MNHSRRSADGHVRTVMARERDSPDKAVRAPGLLVLRNCGLNCHRIGDERLVSEEMPLGWAYAGGYHLISSRRHCRRRLMAPRVGESESKRVAALVQNQTSPTAPSLQLHGETVRNCCPFDFIPINSFCRIPICETPKTRFRRCDAGALDPALARGVGQVRICSAVPARNAKFDGSADNRLSGR